MRALKAWQFDSHGQGVCRVEIREAGYNGSIVVVDPSSQREAVLLSSFRDQWGVFHSVTGFTAAQEDGTRSFIDALIKALTELRRRNESETTDATEVQHASEPRPAEAEGEASATALRSLDDDLDAAGG